MNYFKRVIYLESAPLIRFGNSFYIYPTGTIYSLLGLSICSTKSTRYSLLHLLSTNCAFNFTNSLQISPLSSIPSYSLLSYPLIYRSLKYPKAEFNTFSYFNLFAPMNSSLIAFGLTFK